MQFLIVDSEVLSILTNFKLMNISLKIFEYIQSLQFFWSILKPIGLRELPDWTTFTLLILFNKLNVISYDIHHLHYELFKSLRIFLFDSTFNFYDYVECTQSQRRAMWMLELSARSLLCIDSYIDQKPKYRCKLVELLTERKKRKKSIRCSHILIIHRRKLVKVYQWESNLEVYAPEWSHSIDFRCFFLFQILSTVSKHVYTSISLHSQAFDWMNVLKEYAYKKVFMLYTFRNWEQT